jgi:hypothetical protein
MPGFIAVQFTDSQADMLAISPRLLQRHGMLTRRLGYFSPFAQQSIAPVTLRRPQLAS